MITKQNRSITFVQQELESVRTDLEGLTFRAGIVMKADARVGDGGPRYVTGYILDVWQELQNILKFRTEYYRPEGGTWGVLLSNGSWNGMVGEVLSRSIDVGVSDFLMTSERMAVVDFLPPLLDTGTYVFVKNTHHHDLEWKAFAFPFTTRLWEALAATLLLVMACFVLNWTLSRGKKICHSLFDSIYMAVTIFLLQGDSTLPKICSARTTHVTARMITTVLAAAYSAALVSFLAVRNSKLPFSSFQGLLDEGSYRLGVLEGSAQITYLYRSEDPVLRNIFSRLIHPHLNNMPNNVTVGLERVCSQNKYAFMVELANVYGTLRNLPCDVVKLPHTGIPATMTIIIPKKFPYRSVLSKNVMRMRRTGILQRLRNLNIPTEKEDHEVHVVELRLESVLPVLLQLAVGFIISAFLLLLEILFNSFSLFTNRHRNQILARKMRKVSNIL